MYINFFQKNEKKSLCKFIHIYLFFSLSLYLYKLLEVKSCNNSLFDKREREREIEEKKWTIFS